MPLPPFSCSEPPRAAADILAKAEGATVIPGGGCGNALESHNLHQICLGAGGGNAQRWDATLRQRTPRKLQLIPCSYGFGGGRKAPQEIGEEPDGFLTVKEQAKSKEFYVGILGGKVIRPENPCYIKLENSWIILNSGGGPTPDKPEVILETLQDLNRVSSFLNLRVADIRGCYKKWRAKGAQFPTEPLDNHGHEWRCYMRDPDGYLIEVGQYTETSIRHFKEFSARE